MLTRISIIFLSLLLFAPLGYAKGPKTVLSVIKAGEKIITPRSGSVIPSEIMGKSALGTLPLCSHVLPPVPQPSNLPSATVLNQQKLHSSVEEALSAGRRASLITSPALGELPRMQAEPLDIPPEKYTFLAVDGKPELDAPTFTGTLFEVNLNGKREVFGVVAAHAIATSVFDKGALGRYFTAVISQDGKRIEVPARVVQVAARSFLDLALVKLDLYSVPDVQALPLAQTPVQVGDELHSDGFENDMIVPVEGRFVVETSPTSIRTTMPVVRRLRSGLCGSAVLNENNELVGIHTGSTRSTESYYTDKGFFAPAPVLEAMVKAYHNQGKGVVPFVTQGHTVAYLRVDEYIVAYELSNGDGKHIMHAEVPYKFSHTDLANALKNHPEARYIHIITHRTFWDPSDKALLEDRKDSHGTARGYMYDMEERKLVYSVSMAR